MITHPTLGEAVAALASSTNSFSAFRHKPTGAPFDSEAHLRFFSFDTPAAIRQQILFYECWNYMFVDPTGVVRTASLPDLQDMGGSLQVVASLGDSPTDCNPITVPASLLLSGVISLVPQAGAQALTLNRSSSGLASLEDHKGDQLNLGDVFWPANAPSPPTISILPIVFAVAPGAASIDDHPLDRPLSLQTRASNPHAAIWFDGMAWLYAHNSGESLHARDDIIRFESADQDFLRPNFPCMKQISCPMTGLDSLDPKSKAFHSKFKLQVNSAFLALSSDVALSSPTGPPLGMVASPPPAPPTGVAAPRLSLKEQDRVENTTRCKTTWRLLFAGKTDGSTILALPSLDPVFETVLEAVSGETAQLRFEALVSEATDSASGSTHYLERYASFTHAHTITMFAQVVQRAKLMTKSIMSDVNLTGHLSILHCAPPKTNSLIYQENMKNEVLNREQAFSGEVSSNMTKKVSTLNTQLKLDNPSDLFTMVGTFHVLTAIILGKNQYPSNHTPLVWRHIAALLTVLSGPQGKAWFATQQPDQLRRVMYHLAADFHTIFSSFATHASHPRAQAIVSEGKDVPLELFSRAINISEHIIATVANEIHTGVVSAKYSQQSLLETLLAPTPFEDRKRSTPAGTPAPPSKKPTPSSDQAGGRARTPSGSAGGRRLDMDDEAKKAKGFVKFSEGPGNKLPDSEITVDMSGQAVFLCKNFYTVGFSCKRPNCRFYHLKKLADLQGDRKEKFTTFVNEHPSLSFVTTDTDIYSVAFFPRPPPSLLLDRAELHNTMNALSSDTPPESPPVSAQEPTPLVEPIPIGPEEAEYPPLPPVDRPAAFSEPDPQQPKRTSATDDAWAAANLPSAVQLQLDNPFGKDSVHQCFASSVVFGHILPHLWASSYLSRREWSRLAFSSPVVKDYDILRRQHAGIDFRPLRVGLPPDGTQEELVVRMQKMVTACLLHYRCDLPSVVRFIGGQHTGAHRDNANIFTELRRVGIDPEAVATLEHVFTRGAPTTCNASFSRENFHAYLAYGNHASIFEDPAATKRAFAKDLRKGYSLACDPRMVYYVPNLHFTPQGMVFAPNKKPRPVFDSTFRPAPWCMAINDVLDSTLEPDVHFASTLIKYYTFVWNARITYPTEELYQGDDDVSGAFRQIKYNPNLVGMHATLVFGTLFFMTGQTFGDASSPANWEPVATCRRLYAKYLWSQPDTLDKGGHLLPDPQFTAPPTASEVDKFAKANRDSQNRGILNDDGSRQPPGYDHWVDDVFYCDIRTHFVRTVISSMLALYLVLGAPTDHHRDPLSWEKFNNKFTFLRRNGGFTTNTRTLRVTLPSDKVEDLVDILTEWKDVRSEYSLRDAASLLGKLWDATRINPHMRARLFPLQNAFRNALLARYHALAGYRARRNHRADLLEVQLPSELRYRILSLLSQQEASLLWHAKAKVSMSTGIRRTVTLLLTFLQNPSYEWGCSIGHLIPRDPISRVTGTHSGSAGLAQQPSYRAPTGSYRQLVDRQFILQILDQQGVITLPQAQPLIHLLVQLCETIDLHNTAEHIAGKRNELADFMSRLDRNLSHATHLQQIFQKKPEMSTWSFFQASPALLSAITFRLSCDVPLESLAPPKDLRTIRTRRIHYFRFVAQMKLTDDWTLATASPRRRVIQLAIYTAFLAEGNTIMGLLLKSGTISEYIRQIARFLAVFTHTDPRKYNQADVKLAPEIQNVIKEVERWEDVPNKRNPYLPEMHRCLADLSSSDTPTSMRRSLFRWFGVGISGGFRNSEWAQPDTNPHLISPKLNDRGAPYAFLPSDVVFYSPEGRILTHQQAILLPVHCLGKFSLRHRTQKNNQNGEKRVYTRGSDPRFCAVTNMQQIIRQYHVLVGSDSSDIPLSVFKCESSGAILPLTSSHITSVLRATAEVAYGLKS